jgi:lipopolysaccharide/colanic/teichoic acid biosynthesis glycosyltransferase
MAERTAVPDALDDSPAPRWTGSGLGRPPAFVSAWRAEGGGKRTMDLVLGSVGLVLVSPLLVLIGAVVRMTSPGPALIRQVRLGYRRRPYLMFKFRTMYCGVDDAIHREYVSSMFDDRVEDCAENGLYKLADDPRVTRVGRFLRKSSLDELPQLINVVQGAMSLVGPRPILAYEVDLLSVRNMIRFEVLPGMTGLWQVSGRNALSMPEALELDEEYVRRRSLRFDLGILFRTIPVFLTGKGAG